MNIDGIEVPDELIEESASVRECMARELPQFLSYIEALAKVFEQLEMVRLRARVLDDEPAARFRKATGADVLEEFWWQLQTACGDQKLFSDATFDALMAELRAEQEATA